MCGIAGFLNSDGRPAQQSLVSTMIRAIAHRGPDGSGVYVNGPVGLGHRRLAILDLSSAGAQPMQSSDKRYCITYNGEVYNYLKLREELEGLGCRFRSRSDTEVILNAYVVWGERCVERFNGMFAFAIWDTREKELFLARDRYGIKPLYYGFREGDFYFASEHKAILADLGFPRRFNYEGLIEYFTFQNFFTDATFFKDIKLFPAGCTGKVHADRTSAGLSLRQYWDYDFCSSENDLSHEEYLEELDFLFRRAVKRQLVSDVDVGGYLSGGIDSGAITSAAAAHLPYMKSFTCGFDLHSASGLELAFDERERAEYMSYLFKTEHYEMVLKAGDMERAMPKLVWHLEEPRVGQSYPNFYASNLASKFVKVVLGGSGGDELFGGYPWRYYRAVCNSNFEEYIDKYYLFWQRLIPNRHIMSVFQPIWGKIKDVWTRDIFRDVFKGRQLEFNSPEDYINHSLYFEARTFLHGLLVVEDKLSMAYGLESRVPFLDNDLVDFAMRVPVRMKLGNLTRVVALNENEPGGKSERYFKKTKDGKLLLREVMSRYIPDSVTSAVKQGFSAPDASWFKGESIRYVREMLFNNNAKLFNYMDKKAILSLVAEHFEGKKNRRLLIWSLLNFEQWLDQYSPTA